MVKKTGAGKVIFDNSLKPAQAYNLAKATKVEAIDRFQLILEIFSKRARTTEALLQIRLAKLRRDLTRAKEMVRLAKKGEQPGFMGLGAYEVDVYYESVKKEVHTIRKKLGRIRTKRVLHRERRTKLGFPSISLAGYTDAGKSSLFNALTEAGVQVDTSLFTTLSTTTRLVEISKKRFLITDTVGFIDRLPITLIEAFHSTLEETICSDLVLLVVDASEALENIQIKLSVCLETMEKIGVSSVPIITLFNKIDLLSESELQDKTKELAQLVEQHICISALHRTNINLLEKKILENLDNYVRACFTIPLSNEAMPFISSLFKGADVQKTEYKNNCVYIVFEARPDFAAKVKNRVEMLNGKFGRLKYGDLDAESCSAEMGT